MIPDVYELVKDKNKRLKKTMSMMTFKRVVEFIK